MASKIYVEVLSDVQNNKVNVTVETYVTLFVFRYIRCGTNISINLIRSPRKDDSNGITIDVSSMQFSIFDWNNLDFEKSEAALFKFPVLVNDKCVIAGLCGVCRGLLKLVNDDNTKQLLGFKESCLQAPSETSTWTKFCEIDIIDCTKNIMKLNANDFEEIKSFQLCDEFGKFEKHLSLPVRIHNIYKVARNLAKAKDAQVDKELEEQFQDFSIDKHDKTPRLNKQHKSKVS